MPPQVNCLIL